MASAASTAALWNGQPRKRLPGALSKMANSGRARGVRGVDRLLGGIRGLVDAAPGTLTRSFLLKVLVEGAFRHMACSVSRSTPVAWIPRGETRVVAAVRIARALRDRPRPAGRA